MFPGTHRVSLENTKHPLLRADYNKNRMDLLPEATTVLAHKVFSMLRLS